LWFECGLGEGERTLIISHVKTKVKFSMGNGSSFPWWKSLIMVIDLIVFFIYMA